MSKVRICKLIEGVHMGLGHEGLAKLIRKETKIDVAEDLAEGDLILCMNGAGDKLKLIGCHGLVLGYLRMPRGQRIMKEALQYVPATFGGSGFNYDEACKAAFERRFKGKYETGPLNAARKQQEAKKQADAAR